MSEVVRLRIIIIITNLIRFQIYINWLNFLRTQKSHLKCLGISHAKFKHICRERKSRPQLNAALSSWGFMQSLVRIDQV